MTVTDVLEYLAGGMTEGEILAEFPDLTLLEFDLDVERDAMKPNFVPVKMTLTERPAREVGLSLGYGTDDGLRGDQTLLLNSSISRMFPLKGHTNFQVRLDANNALNRQQFANPGLDPTTTSNFGRVTANANTEARFLVLIGKLTF